MDGGVHGPLLGDGLHDVRSIAWFAAAKKPSARRRGRVSQVDRPATTVWYGEKRREPKSPREAEDAMTDKINDPVAMWQKMVGEMEKGFNSFANQAMASPEFSQAMNRAGGVAAGAQK